MHSSSLPASDLIVPKDTMSFSERDWSALEAEKNSKISKTSIDSLSEQGPVGNLWPSIMENYGILGEIIPILHMRCEFLKPF